MMPQTQVSVTGPALETERVGSHDAPVTLSLTPRQILFFSDCAAFGVAAAEALQQLPPELSHLNRRYRQAIESRQLRRLPEISDWRGRKAQVFLRHDAVFVFALACGNEFGMTNSLELQDVRFEVDLVGRQQTLDRRGPLPNRTAVHAYLSGVVAELSDEPEHRHPSESRIPQQPEDLVWAETGRRENPGGTGEWRPVVYRPTEHPTFVDALDQKPVVCSPRVLMTPGPVKVWRLAGIEPRSVPRLRDACGAAA